MSLENENRTNNNKWKRGYFQRSWETHGLKPQIRRASLTLKIGEWAPFCSSKEIESGIH